MEKIVLKNKEEILVEGGTATNTFRIVVEGTQGIKDMLDKLTSDNLAYCEIKNEGGLTCAIWENKSLVSVTSTKIEKTDNWMLTVALADIDPLLLRVATLENGQKVQDNAIAEMSGIVYA